MFYMKKSWILPVLTVLLLQISLISAIDLTILEEEISDLAIIELDKPAIFELEITNNEESSGIFEIYSLVGRIDLEPKEAFTIAGNATEKITLKVYPRDIPGYFSFEYKIKDSSGDIQTDNLAISIVNLEDAFNLYADNLDPDAGKAIIHFDNKGGHRFEDIRVEFSSVFFVNTDVTFDLAPNQKKQFEIDVNKVKTKDLLAGPYILNANLIVEGKTATTSSLIRFIEKSGLDTSETIEGFLLRRHEITKTNRGNVPVDVETIIKRNSFQALFTTFNIIPTNKDTVKYSTFYIFEKKLAPGEELSVIARTNWWLLVLIITSIVVIIHLSKKYAHTKLKLTKTITFVKTKGGEFALKINIVVKAKDFVEHIRVIDKLPGMVKLYERYGTITPDKIDEKNKRIEWNIENLDAGEERVFSYIIYSKMGIVGKFELPEAEAFYDFKGKLHEVTSNKSYFINEPDKQRSQAQRDIDEMF